MSSPPPPLHHGTPASSAEPSLERAIGPVALILGPSAALVLLYLALQATAQGVLGPELAAQREAPLATLAERIAGPVGHTVILGCTVLAIVGALAADMLGAPRALLAAAESGMLPSALTRIHPRWRTPWVAIVTFAAATVVWVLSHSTHAEVAATALLLGAGTLYYLARGRIGVRAPAP